MSNLITIDQLLESVDLDFEPRWVTKNKNGGIYVWATRPHYRSGVWFGDESVDSYITKLKLAEFEGKSSGECIYEVPLKTTGKIEPLKNRMNGSLIIPPMDNEVVEKINELVDAVNELKAKEE